MSHHPAESIITTWKTAYEDSVWRRLGGVHSREPAVIMSDVSLDGEFLLLGPALPTPGEPRIAELVVHPHPGDESLHWTLVVRAAPMANPPVEIHERDAELGGRAGLVALIEQCAPAGAPPVASFHIKYLLEAARYRCKVLPVTLRRGGPHQAALGLASEGWMEEVGYRFAGAANGLGQVSIMYLHVEDRFVVDVHASGLLKPGAATWLPYADEITALVRESLFNEQEEMTT